MAETYAGMILANDRGNSCPLLRDKSTGKITQMLMGTGEAATEETYTDDFKTGTTPLVLVTNTEDDATLRVSASSATAHTITPSAGTPTYNWIAIGEKANDKP